MWISRTSSWLMALVAVLLLAPQALAQREIYHVPPAINRDPVRPDLLQPFVDPTAFPTDYQFFAPADLNTFGNGPPPKTGWFFTYDRIYMNVNRPQSITGTTYSAPFTGDWTWGNRYDMGYMSKEDHGWLISLWHVAGPTFADPNIVSNSVTFTSRQRLNASNFWSIEVNKTFRSKTHYGSYFEPFVGVRYIYFRNSQQQFYTGMFQYYDEVGNLQPAANADVFMNQEVKNQILGGQLGLRWFMQKGRWTLSTDVRMFAGQNFQFITNTTRLGIPNQNNNNNVGNNNNNNNNNFNNNNNGQNSNFNTATGGGTVNSTFMKTPNASLDEFVPMGELRAEAAYSLTRDLSFRFGLAIMDYGRGIARPDTTPFEINLPNAPVSGSHIINSQSLIMAGLTFGFVYNR